MILIALGRWDEVDGIVKFGSGILLQLANRENGSSMAERGRKSNSIDAYVGGRIRLIRTTRGITQNELADRLGITFQQIQKYERGVNRVGASRLLAITRLLNVPITFFFDGIPGQSATTNYVHDQIETENLIGFFASSEGIQLARAFTRVSDAAVRRKIVDLIQALGDDKSETPHDPTTVEDPVSEN